MTTRQLLPIWFLVAVGLFGGLLFGIRQPAQYEAEVLVSLDSALQLPHYDASPVAASFNEMLGLAETRQRAADQTSLDTNVFEGVFSTRVEDAPVVRVSQQSADREAAMIAVQAMSTAALHTRLDAESGPNEIALVTAEATLEAANAELEPLVQAAGQGNADLEDIVRRRTFDLVSAEAQLRETEDPYWLTRLPGDIEAIQAILSDVEPVVEDWRNMKQAADEAEDEVEPLRERQLELERARAVVESETALSDVNVTQISARQTVGRFGAAGAVIGALLGAVVAAVLRRPVST